MTTIGVQGSNTLRAAPQSLAPAQAAQRTATSAESARLAAAPASASVEPAQSAASARIGRLIAGVAPGGIDFSATEPRVNGPAFPLYTRPADRNAAATGVMLGRSLDIRG